MTKSELQELRYEVLNLRNMNEISKKAETKLLHKLNALQEALNFKCCLGWIMCAND